MIINRSGFRGCTWGSAPLCLLQRQIIRCSNAGTGSSQLWGIGGPPHPPPRNISLLSGNQYSDDPYAEGRKEMFYLTTHSTHCIYGYMASDILWLRTNQIARKETRCRHMGYSFRIAARVILYASSHRPDVTPLCEQRTY